MPDRSVVELIWNWCQTNKFPFELACTIVAGESDFDTNLVGDNGTSFGLIQVHVPAHGHDQAYWSGIEGAKRSLDEMKSRWLSNLTLNVSDWETWSNSKRYPRFSQIWQDMQGCKPPTDTQVVNAVNRGKAVADWYRGLGPVEPRPVLAYATVNAISGARLRSDANDISSFKVVPNGERVEILADEYIPVNTSQGVGWIGGRLLTDVGENRAALRKLAKDILAIVGDE